MTEQEPSHIPISWVSHVDLEHSRPELVESIGQLSDEDLQFISKKIGDALQETYWLAMGVVLDDFFHTEEKEENGMD